MLQWFFREGYNHMIVFEIVYAFSGEASALASWRAAPIALDFCVFEGDNLRS